MKNKDNLQEKSTQKLSAAIARGKRLRFIRDEMLQISRRKFGEKHQDLKITASCLHNWEEARFSGLQVRHMDQLIEAFRREGIICEKYWLLEGIGNPPRRINTTQLLAGVLPQNTQTFTEEEAIAYELRAFYETHPAAFDAIVHDDGVVPLYLPGDYVAGARYTASAIHKALGQCCIVQTLDGQILIRKVEAGTESGVYSLFCINPQTKLEESVRLNTKLLSAAPIIWWRRPVWDPL